VRAQTAEERISAVRAAARAADPELAARFERYQAELGLSLEEADILTGSRALATFFDAALGAHDEPASVASWVVNDLRAGLGERDPADLLFQGEGLGRLAALVDGGTVSRRAARDVLAEMMADGGDPAAIARRLDLEAVTDAGALEPVVDDVLAAWPEKVAEFRAGNANLLGMFMGQVMKRTGGKADPQLTRRLLEHALNR
jgi:Asp-tRNA(Asn)/Glu-tRNA(Gln) amidotransferase B subunit